MKFKRKNIIDIATLVVQLILLIFVIDLSLTAGSRLDKILNTLGQAQPEAKKLKDTIITITTETNKATGKITGFLNKTNEAVNKTTEAVNKTTEAVNETAEAVNKTAGATNKAAGEITGFFNKTNEAVNKTAEATNKITGKIIGFLNKTNEAVNKTTGKITGFLDQTAEATVKANEASKLFVKIANDLNKEKNKILSIPLKDGEEWLKLKIAAENRCEKYSRSKYPYDRKTILDGLKERCDNFYTPYSDKFRQSSRGIDVEHIVATSEAHDSGMCGIGGGVYEDEKTLVDKREALAIDSLNLTLATKRINRHLKNKKDAGEWLPDHRQCWFVWRVVKVKKKYNLTVDAKEANTLRELWESCELVEDEEPPPPECPSKPKS